MQLMKYVLPKLMYEMNGLEPIISKGLLDIHYNKHHQAYVNNLNAAMESLVDAISKQDLPKIVSLQPTIIFNGGSHINHSMYWENLSPISQNGGKFPDASSLLAKKIEQSWGSKEKFIEYFTKRATGLKGSGWAWLALNTQSKMLEYFETKDQDTISMSPDLKPLLTVDVWEHSYYIDYKNARADYLKNIWKIVNWSIVEARLNEAMK